MKQIAIILAIVLAAVGGWYFFSQRMSSPHATSTLPEQKNLVTIYGNSSCVFCEQAKALLDRVGAKYVEKDVTNPTILEEMFEKTDHAQGIPQVLIGDKHIGGFADLRRLHDEDKLKTLLTQPQ